jgi:hypothetical protein
MNHGLKTFGIDVGITELLNHHFDALAVASYQANSDGIAKPLK